MDSLLPIEISGSALSAQRLRMALIASNLANIYTTQTPEGGPYRRRDLVVQAAALPNFQETIQNQLAASEGGRGAPLSAALTAQLRGVEPVAVAVDEREPLLVHAPWHPDADANGNVAFPNISVMEEMVNAISASRCYEANLAVVRMTRNMITQALQMARP